jgi:uncharacterized protein
MPDSDVSTEQSMDDVLKKIERKLVEGDKEDPPPSAEVLKLSDAAGDGRKGRAQNRSRPGASLAASESAEAGSNQATADEVATMLASSARAPTALDEPATGPAETLEDIVRELVKPMLRGWLDARLGEVLNRLVQAELAKALEEIEAPRAEAAN